MILFFFSDHIIDILSSLGQSIYLTITEIIPCVVVTFSFLAKTFRSNSVTFSQDTPSSNIQSEELTIEEPLTRHFTAEHLKEQESMKANEQADIE